MCYIAKLLNLWEKRRGENIGETEIDRKRGRQRRERDEGRKGEGWEEDSEKEGGREGRVRERENE